VREDNDNKHHVVWWQGWGSMVKEIELLLNCRKHSMSQKMLTGSNQKVNSRITLYCQKLHGHQTVGGQTEPNLLNRYSCRTW